MADHDISEVHHLPIGRIICYAKAAIAFEQCVQHGGNLQECAQRFRDAIRHCNEGGGGGGGAAPAGGGGLAGGGTGTSAGGGTPGGVGGQGPGNS